MPTDVPVLTYVVTGSVGHAERYLTIGDTLLWLCVGLLLNDSSMVELRPVELICFLSHYQATVQVHYVVS